MCESSMVGALTTLDFGSVMGVNLDAASCSNMINTPQEEGWLLYHLKDRSLII